MYDADLRGVASVFHLQGEWEHNRVRAMSYHLLSATGVRTIAHHSFVKAVSGTEQNINLYSAQKPYW
jgi:hypothetical protein